MDEQDHVALPLDDEDPDQSSQLGLDEQDPVEGWMNRRTPGLTTPLTRRVARCCYLCAGAVYVVLLRSPTIKPKRIPGAI